MVNNNKADVHEQLFYRCPPTRGRCSTETAVTVISSISPTWAGVKGHIRGDIRRSCNAAGTATLSVFFQALLSLGFEPRLVFFARSGTGSQTFKTLDVALTFSWRQQEDSCLIPVLLTVTCTLLRKITRVCKRFKIKF